MRRRFIAIFLLTGLFRAQADIQEEMRFIEGLTAEGFPNLAQTVLNRALQQFPDLGKSAPELQIRILISAKQFDAAAQQIVNQQSSIVNPSELWLFLAGSAYNNNQKSAAEAAYKNYFTSATDPMAQAAFNYGTLLEERGDLKSARSLYEKVLSFPPERSERGPANAGQRPKVAANIGKSARPVKMKLAKQLVEETPERAKKLCEDVQLGGLDLWFGQAVVLWADIMIRQNEWGEAQSVLETQLETLKSISDAVNSSDVPIAGARYFLGTCYEHSGKEAEALTQYFNVYAKYGDSEYGPQAQERAQALKTKLEAAGKTVKIDFGANKAKMEESALRVARRLFFDKKYNEAVPAYLKTLNQYPEGEDAVTALRELTLCYIHLNDSLAAKTVGRYTGERFAAREAAADALLAAGKCALDEKQNELAWWIYDRYFEDFPNHPQAPAVLYTLSGLRKNEGYLFQCLEKYPDSPYAARALSRLAWNAYENGNYPLAAERFEKVLQTETDLEKQTRARFALGDSYRQQELWSAGLACFQTLEKSLSKAADGFGTSDEMQKLVRSFSEKSVFYQGICLAKLGEPEKAVSAFNRFIENFQGSEFIPQAQLAKGSALMELKRYDDALATFATFGESSDRKFLEPALFYRGQACFETGAYEASFQTLEKLLNNWPESAFYFEAKLLQGRAYAAAGKNADAVRVLSDVLSFSGDDELLNRASLELGRAQADPKEKLASFQRVALLADPEKHGNLIAEALYESLPLYLELNRPQDLLTDAARLEKDFPSIGKSADVALLKTKAEAALEQQKEGTTNLH